MTPVLKQIPLLAVVGPTASGKTTLVVKLAAEYGGEVISADSMQIYKGMSIATAKPSESEMNGIPHHLLDFLEPSKPFSAAEYSRLAHEAIKAIHSRGRLPVLAGGTGLYINSVIKNIRYCETKSDDALREALKKRAENFGAQVLLNELSEFDPESAARLHPNNLGRIIRAIEVYRLSGLTMTEQNRRSLDTPKIYDSLIIGICYKNRQKLYDRINKRVDIMLETGLLEEAEAAFNASGYITAAQAIGHKELFPYFRGEISLATAVESLKMETRRYAKRQMTWFSKLEGVRWIEGDVGEDLFECAKSEVEKWRMTDA